MERKNHGGGSPWEPIVGYSRAVRVGNIIEVAGTTATISGEIQYPGDAEAQTRVILQIIEKALSALGAKMENVIRTRIFVTNIDEWEKVGKVHGEFFGKILPATTMVEVSRLIHPDLVVEMEAAAVVG
jgi:enamine deaminase RidA (YjgF/YER057c/UK114 family)